MSEEENKKLLEHYKSLISGKIKTGNPTRDDLIVSDAERHLADLVKKNTNLVSEQPKPIEKPKEVKETKPKEKK